MRILCVAEKPSIAKSITQILSGGQFATRATQTPYIKNYDFDYPQLNAQITVTAVVGHLNEHDFDGDWGWQSCDPFALFDAPIKSFVAKDKKPIEKNLQDEARRANQLMIWTDCDREGEHIGAEIVRICQLTRPNITVRRARFSAIIAQQIHNAVRNPVQLDQRQADAVEARTLLDLRCGAAFTRLQTMNLKSRLGELSDVKVISYGPCQFPTLGFVVAQYNKVGSFRPEPFWYIYLAIVRDGSTTVFAWKRGHIFDLEIARVLYEYVLANPIARVVKITQKETKKWKPLPLTTVELQKAASRILKIAPKKALDIAEGLYQKGFLSYPRTETDQYDPQFDFAYLIEKQTADANWGQFATNLQQGRFDRPRNGKNNDKAHPPIHPTAHANNLTGDDKKIYEYVTRRFLASCSKDALGFQTTVDLECNGEAFSASGLVVLEKNYLEVYPYDKWTDSQLPEFQEGEEFEPDEIELREGKTSRPKLLTEADLVTLMDKNGIGTDATIAQHIQTIVDREYVIEKMQGNTKYLIPSTLGIGLVEGYSQIDFEKNLSKPFLRRDTEKTMVEVCDGARTKQQMLHESIARYKEMYNLARNHFEQIVETVRGKVQGRGHNVPGTVPEDDDDDAGDDGGNNGGGAGARGGRGRGRGSRGTSTRGSRGRGAGRGDGAGPSRRGRQPPPDDEDLDDDKPKWPPTRKRTKPPPPEPQTAPPSNGNVVYCRCNLRAVEAMHEGRRRWTCPEEICEFFEWIDSTKPLSPAIPIKRTFSTAVDQEDGRRCRCELTAALRTSTKDGPNKGRKFWVCPNSQNSQCGFFEWDDEPPRAREGGAQGQGPSKCFKCQQEGHFSNACPNEASSGLGYTAQKRARNETGNSAVICYKCNEPGHYSNDCPSMNAGTSRTWSKQGGGGGGGGGGGDGCYKCGESGHWANACPGANSGTTSYSGPAGTRGSKRGRSVTRGTTRGRKRGGRRGASSAGDD